MRRSECHDRIEEVRQSYQTARQIVKAFIEIATEQPKYLSGYGVSLQALRDLEAELHDIYFARVFACFESSLRHFWRTAIRDTRPPTEQLLSSIAGRLAIPQTTLDEVQEIRKFRNHLIHEEHELTQRLTVDDAGRHLNTFLARLPLEW
jgi:hypothetical protein